MVHESSLVVMLGRLVGRIPRPPAPTQRGCGRPVVYPDRLLEQAEVLSKDWVA
jgi:hypothetical protein